jgi:hypothetical protein
MTSNGATIKLAPGWKALDSGAAGAKDQAGEVILRLVNSGGGSISIMASKDAPGVTADSLADKTVSAAKTTNAVSVDQAPQKSIAKIRAGDATVVRWVSTSRKNRQSTASSDYFIESSGYVWQVTALASKDSALQSEEDEMAKSFGVVGTPQ